MKYFAVMYTRRVSQSGTDGDWRNYPVPACGTDSRLVLDGRLTVENMKSKAIGYAQVMNQKLGKGYIGVRIERGESFIDSQPVTQVILF